MDKGKKDYSTLKSRSPSFNLEPKIIHFSLKYFEFPNNDIDPKALKKAINLMAERNKKTWKYLKDNNKVILEKDLETKKIAIKLLKNKELFVEKFKEKVWDLVQNGGLFRMFGIFDDKEHIFCLLQIDPYHKSRK